MPIVTLPKTNLKRIVIIGGGFAGLTLIKELRKAPFQVVLIDKNNYHTFQPLLYPGNGFDHIEGRGSNIPENDPQSNQCTCRG